MLPFRLTMRVFRLCLLLLLPLCGGLQAAGLSWASDTGWVVADGVSTNLDKTQNEKALELMNKARSAQEGGNLRSALKNYNRVVRRYARSIYAPEALFQQGLIRIQRREGTRAFEAFNSIISRYPNYGRFNELIELQYGIADRMLNGQRQRLWGIFPGFPNRQRGLEFFTTIQRTAPFTDFGPPALLRVAQGARKLKNPEVEIDALERFINTYSLDQRAPDAYLDLAQANESLVVGPRYDQGSTREALSFFEDFSILYPQHPRVGEAETGSAEMRTMLARSRIVMGDWYLRYRSNFTAARIFYNEAITIFPESEIAQQAQERIAKVDTAEARFKANPPSKAWRYIDWLWR